MRLDLLPPYQDERNFRKYVITNFNRIAALFTEIINVPEAWHEIGAAGEPAFQNAWVNYGGAYPTAAYRLVDGRLQMRGLIKNGSFMVAAFTLPLAYRPSKYVHTITLGSDVACGLRIDSTGAVILGTPTPANASYISLECSIVLLQG